MSANKAFSVSFHPRVGDSALARRLSHEIEGQVHFDRASRARYSSDASIYQIEPVGIVVPRTAQDVRIAVQIAAEEGIPILARGAGTSQCGQTVGAALIVDDSKYLNRLLDVDAANGIAIVEPGLVLDQLNSALKQSGLWFPVDVSTSAQATLGGMAGNNSCGSRSIRYGNMVHNVLGIDALLADGSQFHFGPSAGLDAAPARLRELVARIHAIVEREADEIETRWPKVLRRVQGYNIDMIRPYAPHNLAHLLVGSEGTLAWFERISLKLSPLPRAKALGVCHFSTFYAAMQAPQHIVKLDPAAVELVDRTMIGLARENQTFRGTVDRFVVGDPEAILLVEFSGEDVVEQLAKLKRLVELMGDLGLPGSVVEIPDATLQREIWEVRKAGLNIMMSMKGDGKPVSFIEDCAVPFEPLAEYTRRLTEVFERHGTQGTWYAHASVGTLHVRPVLNMKADGASKMRTIAEEACALVREFKGAYSGEHGDGLVRSQWIEPIIGPRLTASLAEIKALFDPKGLMNPGKIVRPPRQDDRALMRYKPGYTVRPIETVLDWGEWGGLAGAAEMCNNNGHCRKFDGGTMCPSFRVTGDEVHLTRGRANTLRMALAGELGQDTFASDELREAMDLCVGCKGCKRECPTGVDMTRMKIEFLHHYHKRHGLTIKDRLIAYLPRYAPIASRFAPLFNLRDRIPWIAALSESLLGFSAQRELPTWRRDTFFDSIAAAGRNDALPGDGTGEVVLFVDCFNNYHEPENAHAALRVLEAAGYVVHIARARDRARPLCCGRTFLSRGMLDQAKQEVRRVLAALKLFVARGVPIVGLEPSCIYTLRDEFPAMLPGSQTTALAARALTFEEFLAQELEEGKLKLALKALAQKSALVHGHCHQKAFGGMPAVHKTLALVPELEVRSIESSCCGMAGAFGYEAEHYEVSMKMAEAALLPAVRAASPDTLIVADGTSCRRQIADGTLPGASAAASRKAIHVARVLEQALS